MAAPGGISPAEILEFHCRVVEARNLKNLQMFGRMDPYVIARINTNEDRSQICKDGHTTPAFGWKCMLNGTVNDVAYINVVNKTGGLSTDDLVGTATLSLGGLVAGSVSDVWLPLKKGSEVTGEVHVRAQLMHQGERPIVPAGADLAAVGRSVLAAGLGAAPAPAPAAAPAAAPPAFAPPTSGAGAAPSPYYAPPPAGVPGYPGAAPPAYGPPAGYPGAAPPSYSAPGPFAPGGFSSPAPAYAPSYGAPGPFPGAAPGPYGAAPSPYGAPAPGYPPAPGYGFPAPGPFSGPSPYGAPAAPPPFYGYGAPEGAAYPAPAPYGMPVPGMPLPPPGYGY